MNPYRTLVIHPERPWGATRFVKLYIKVARILRIRGYHQMHNWFRGDDGRLIHNRCAFTYCSCTRCNTKHWLQIKKDMKRQCQEERHRKNKRNAEEYEEKYPMY